MKLRDLLIEKLSETTLFEMAFSRQEAWRRVSGLTRPIASHIVKLLIMPYSGDRQHWKNEIENWLNGEHGLSEIILKPQNRRLALQEYRDWMILQPEVTINDKHFRMYKKQYPDEKIVVSPTIQLDFDHVMEAIVRLLAANEYVDMDEILK